jgi:RNA polymerase sigma-70 factor (ECF subfamily)
LEEHDIVRRSLDGDAEAFGLLVQAHQNAVYGLCLRMTTNREDALDLANEAFLKAFRSLRSFDTAYPFRPWLLRIATNLCIDFLKRKQRSPVPMETHDLELISPAEQHDLPHIRVQDEEDRQAVRRAVERLPENYRAIVILHYFNQLSYQDISQSLGIPIGTVGTSLHRAKKLLREALSAREVAAG